MRVLRSQFLQMLFCPQIVRIISAALYGAYVGAGLVLTFLSARRLRFLLGVASVGLFLELHQITFHSAFEKAANDLDSATRGSDHDLLVHAVPGPFTQMRAANTLRRVRCSLETLRGHSALGKSEDN